MRPLDVMPALPYKPRHLRSFRAAVSFCGLSSEARRETEATRNADPAGIFPRTVQFERQTHEDFQPEAGGSGKEVDPDRRR
ncbi:MAG: hypothetical protein KDJ73_06385, partial [Notoacmeibacter sp.]|nr:hypothetical protein [Notoacmeibacter sp.]